MARLGFTIRQFSVIFAVTPETVREYIRTGRLLAQKVSGLWYVNSASLAQFLKEQEISGLSPFKGDSMTERKLEKLQEEFLALILWVGQDPESNAQERLFEVAWQILSTRFIPEYEQLGASARGTVEHWVEKVGAGDNFLSLFLAWEFYKVLRRKVDKITA